MANIRRRLQHIKQEAERHKSLRCIHVSLPLEKTPILGLPPSHRCVQMLQARRAASGDVPRIRTQTEELRL